MSDSRAILLHSLRSSLDGNCVDMAVLESLTAEMRNLDLTEKSAWLQLNNWEADRQLRRDNPQHMACSQRRMEQLCKRLEQRPRF